MIDLERNVVPISKASSSLAALIKRAAAGHTPIVVTQKGYPTGVLLGVSHYVALAALNDAARAVVAGEAGALERLAALVNGAEQPVEEK